VERQRSSWLLAHQSSPTHPCDKFLTLVKGPVLEKHHTGIGP
jgi:hypothetical protein